MAISPGAQATQRFLVTDGDTATAVGSGDVPVLATPRVIAWCEAVTVAAVASELEEGQTTVGSAVRLDHLRPTPVGDEVEVAAEVTDVAGRTITFAVTATDGGGTAASGEVVRVALDRQTFIDRLPT